MYRKEKEKEVEKKVGVPKCQPYFELVCVAKCVHAARLTYTNTVVPPSGGVTSKSPSEFCNGWVRREEISYTFFFFPTKHVLMHVLIKV